MEILLILLLAMMPFDNFKKPMKLMGKQEFAKTREFLDKELEKDSVAAGYKYLYSLYFLDSANSAYDLDSAYFWINRAIVDWEYIDQKESKDLAKANWDLNTLTGQKEHCDSLGYQISATTHTEASYQLFLDKFPTARQSQQAVLNRNAIAFNSAQKVHTYQAYLIFIEKYPHAEQIEVASNRYERLLFRSKTGDGSLVSFKKFYAEHPESPFRNQTLEQIFEISTARHKVKNYIDFFRLYPSTKWGQKAYKMAIHLAEFGTNEFQRVLDLSARKSQKDSIQNLLRQDHFRLMPFYENGKFGFLSLEGDEILPAKYDFVSESYFCQPSRDPALLISEDEQVKVINRRGTEITSGNWENTVDLGNGLILLKGQNQQEVWHESGFQIIPGQWTEFKALGSSLLGARNERMWSIFTYGGRFLFEGSWEKVEFKGDFLLFWKNGRFAISSFEKVWANLENPELPELRYLYEDSDLLDKTFLHVFRDENEGIISPDLKTIVQLSDHSIYEVPGGWMVENDEAFELFDQDFSRLNKSFSDISFNTQWLALKEAGMYKLKSLKGDLYSEILFDSLRLLGENIALAFDEEGSTIIFPNKIHVGVKKLKEVRLLTTPNTGPTALEYLYTLDSVGTEIVYDNQGEKWSVRNLDNLKRLDNNYLSFKSRDKLGVAGNDLVVKQTAKFDGLESLQNGFITTLRNGKFGLINPQMEIEIKPYFDQKLQVINNDAFLAYKSGTYGIVNSNNRQILKFDYGQAQIWTDSLMLLSKEEEWTITNIYTGETMISGIESFEFIKTDEGKYIKYLKDNRIGMVFPNGHSHLKATYDDIYLLDSTEQDLFVAEKNMVGNEIRVSYFNQMGVEIVRQFYSSTLYERVVCGG